jgi:hypothetical protein
MKERKLPSYQVTADAKEEYRKETDALYAWFCDEINIEKLASELTVKEVYDRYKTDCETNGNRPYSKDKFSKRFRKILSDRCAELNIDWDPKQRDLTGNNRIYTCVSFKNPLTPLTADSKKVSDKKWRGY